MSLEIRNTKNYTKVEYKGLTFSTEWYLKGQGFHLQTGDGYLRIMGKKLIEIPDGSFLEVKGEELVPIEDKQTIEEMLKEMSKAGLIPHLRLAQK